jgi:hypothetical protein
MERAIGSFKRLINARTNIGVNAGNVVDRLALMRAVMSFGEDDGSLDDEINLLVPRKFGNGTYIDQKSDDEGSGSQLWAPLLPKCKIAEISIGDKNKFFAALKSYYKRTYSDDILATVTIDPSLNVSIAGCGWAYNYVYRSEFSREHTGAKARGSHYVMVYADYLK